MTAPDHRPYLLPTDLRTAEDVARWLDEETRIGGSLRLSSAWHVRSDLRARLDRERRQACERGAEDCERRLAELGPEPEEPTIDIWGTEALRARLRESALAFRAAAKPAPSEQRAAEASAPDDLFWHCLHCGAHDPVEPTGGPESYALGDWEPCIDCGDGQAHVVTLRLGAAYEQGRALGMDVSDAWERAKGLAAARTP